MLMHDFYGGFSLEEPSSKAKKDSLADATLRGIGDYQERKNISESFDISYAVTFLSEMKKEYVRCEKCIVNIEKKKTDYVITLIMLDEKNEPIKTTTKEMLGRKIRSKSLSQNTEKFMDGKNSRILTI